MSIIRKIIEIDEQACDGCGNCVLECAENALAIIDGKARVISDRLCDGIGNCLQSCPQNALFIIEREAQPFDIEAVAALQARLDAYFANYDENAENEEYEDDAQQSVGDEARESSPHTHIQTSMPTARTSPFVAPHSDAACPSMSSQGAQWPVKLRLVPHDAPFLQDAHIILAADCAPAVLQNFHALRNSRENTCVLLACPKFEAPRALAHKLLDIVQANKLQKLDIYRMEVPCCKVLADVALRVVLEFAQTAQLAPPPIHIHLVDRNGNIL